MRIANPIYDTVFKYLLEDNQLARILVSTILGEEILALEFRPQKRTTEIGQRFLTVYRLDFAATVRNAAGELRQVLIEIQKAKLATDIMRFRRYLGAQYRDPANAREVSTEAGQARRALPLFTIYFLGHALEHTKAPVIRVRRTYTDMTTQPITKKEPFIESLTHDSVIIQIPYLRKTHGTEIEALLQIFDQDLAADVGRHSLEIDETRVPKPYRPFLCRLQRAVVEPEVAEAMEVEDEILAELQTLERSAEQERFKREAAEARAGAAEARAGAAEARAGAAEEQVAQERAEKERLRERLRQAGLDP